MIMATRYFAASVTIFALIAAPSFAQKRTVRMTAARAAAMRACNIKAAPYVLHTWGNYGLYVYRACMAEHRQAE